MTVQCVKCDFTYDPAKVPGGLCPRCLLLGMHGNDPGGFEEEDEEEVSLEMLADDELAMELPNFELEEPLGRGGAGVVWKARERVLNRHVAIKLLHNTGKDPDFVDRFTREARVMAQLNHPHIVTLYSFGRTRSNHCYLVMEMVEGASLADLLNGELLDLPTSLNIIQGVCAALRHAHEAGFMHRDIKPGNVLLDSRGRVKVADFGLARLSGSRRDSTTITKKGWAVGTPHYIAPEQAKGAGNEDQRADIYSVGVVLYQMLTGELPRGVFRPPSAKQKLDKRLDDVVLRALQEEPEKRYQHIAELSEDVEKVRESVDPELLADQQEARHAGRWRRRFEVALAIAVSLVLGFIVAWYARDLLGSVSLPAMPANAHHPDGGVKVVDPPQVASWEGPAIQREIRLQPPLLSSGSLFGSSLSLSGEWLAVGAPNDASQNHRDTGCVYLYRRDVDGKWRLQECLSNPHEGSHSRFGYDVVMDGVRLVITSPSDTQDDHELGTVDLYELAAGNHWKISSHSSYPLMHTAAPGAKVQIAGNHLVEFDLQNEAGGQASPRSFALFTQPGPNAAWKAEFTGPAKGFPFLSACAMPGPNEMIACLANPEDAKLFGQSSAPLVQATSLGEDWKSKVLPIPPPAAPSGEEAAPKIFRALAASERYAIASNAKWNHLRGTAWVLRKNANGVYVHETWLNPSPEMGLSEFGKALALHRDWAAVGADQFVVEDAHRGAACLYHRGEGEAGTWDRIGLLPGDAKGGAKGFGFTLALTSRMLVVGAPRTGAVSAAAAPDDEAGSGAVFVYEFQEPLQ